MSDPYGLNLAVFNPTGTLAGIPDALAGAAKANNAIQAALNPGTATVTQSNVLKDMGLPTTTTTGGIGTGGGYSANPASASFYNGLIDQLNHQIGQLGTQGQLGHQNIADSYLSGFNSLTGQKNTAQNAYDTSTAQTQRDNQDTKSRIAQGAYQGLNSLQRLLGVNGSGSSSASQILAPYAAGEQANQQQQQVNKDYGDNITALDTNWKKTQNDFNNGFNGLLDERTNKDRGLDSQLDSTHANLLNQIAQFGSYVGKPIDPSLTGQVNALGDQVNQLSRQQVTAPTPVSYAAPDLAKYNYNPAAAPVDSNAGSLGSNLGAFYNLINPKDKTKTATAVGA